MKTRNASRTGNVHEEGGKKPSNGGETRKKKKKGTKEVASTDQAMDWSGGRDASTSW
jgi:hypothetical protein